MVLLHNKYFLQQIKAKKKTRKSTGKNLCSNLGKLPRTRLQTILFQCLFDSLSFTPGERLLSITRWLTPLLFPLRSFANGFFVRIVLHNFFNLVFVYLSLLRQFSYKYFYINVNSFCYFYFLLFRPTKGKLF